MSSYLDVWPLLLVGMVSLFAWLRALLRARREEGPAILVFGSPAPARPAPARPAGARIHPAAPIPLAVPVQEEAPPAPAGGWGAFDGGRTIAVNQTMDGTIQLLPGWLEVVRGHAVGPEIRFVRVSGDAVPQITLGRSEGPEFRHIQIPERTVSRLHAKMCFQEGEWRIANLSSTNPVRVNGRTPGEGDWLVLGEGDQVELGSVELRFHRGLA